VIARRNFKPIYSVIRKFSSIVEYTRYSECTNLLIPAG
jgi:hypothetical protein